MVSPQVLYKSCETAWVDQLSPNARHLDVASRHLQHSPQAISASRVRYQCLEP